jgi:hypothetical protein
LIFSSIIAGADWALSIKFKSINNLIFK